MIELTFGTDPEFMIKRGTEIVSAIPIFAEQDLIPEVQKATSAVFSGWTNLDFGTFTSAGLDITAAISAAYGHAVTDEQEFLSGDVIHLDFTLTLSSGSLPLICLYKGGSFIGSHAVASGANSIDITVPSDGTYAIMILTMGASSFSTSGTTITIDDLGWADLTTGAWCAYDNNHSNI